MLQNPDKLLAELIALPSVNPAFLPAGDSRAGEWRVADFLAAGAAKAGLPVEFQEVFPAGAASPARRNVIVRLTPSGRTRRRIILAPHLDTVGGDPLTDDYFRPRKIGGRLHGRGACDTKGSVAAMFAALLAVARSGPVPRDAELVFVGLVDEENGQCGSRALARARWKADLAIVGEPTELQVVTAHKGDLWLKLVTAGKAAHGARPELGVNAVHAMARVIDALETGYARKLRQRRHPLLGSPTINVGMVHGGAQPNIVPDRCEIQVDRRTLPGENDAKVQREIVRFLKAAGSKVELISAKGADCVPLETSSDLPLVRQLLAVTGQKAGVGVDFFCDAAILASGGIPSVVFGPGNIAQAHTRDEWISLRSLEDGARLLTQFLRSLL